MILTIHLSENEKLLIKSGQKVDFETPLDKEKNIEEATILISSRLGVSPDKIFRFITKFVDETIHKGDIIAQKKSMFGQTKIHSEYEGILKEINHKDGSIVLQIQSEKSQTHKAFFKGEVSQIVKDEIHLKIEKLKDFDLKSVEAIKSDIGGPIYYLPHDVESVEEDEVQNKIIICETISEYLQAKLEALNITGFISVYKLSKPTEKPTAQLKQIVDLKKIKEAKLPYCILCQKDSRLYLYE